MYKFQVQEVKHQWGAMNTYNRCVTIIAYSMLNLTQPNMVGLYTYIIKYTFVSILSKQISPNAADVYGGAVSA